MKLNLSFIILALLSLPCSKAGWPLGTSECVTNCNCPDTAPRCWHRVLAGLSQCVDAPQPPEEPFLYLHVPKTGGNTFRSMAEAAFGADRLCLEFGKHKETTSDLVRKIIYSKLWRGTWPEVARRNCSFISGHAKSTAHISTFGLRYTLATVRHPEDRLISQYYKRLEDNITSYHAALSELETFEEFVTHRFDKFLTAGVTQWQMLRARDIPPQAFGFIGITERYPDSIDMFNAAYNQNFVLTGVRNKSEMREVESGARATLTDAMRKELTADLRLYHLANDIFDERKRMHDACKPYVHGAIYDITQTEVTGFAWWAHSDDPVKVRAVVDDETVGVKYAVDGHPLRDWTVPRHGFVGFKFHFDEPVQPDQELRIEVAKTGQLLGSFTRSGNKGKLLWRDIVPDDEYDRAQRLYRQHDKHMEDLQR